MINQGHVILFKLLSLCQMISQNMSLQIVTVVDCISTISAYIWTLTMYLFNMSLHIAISMCYVIHNYDILKVPKEQKHIWENTTYIKDPSPKNQNIYERIPHMSKILEFPSMSIKYGIMLSLSPRFMPHDSYTCGLTHSNCSLLHFHNICMYLNPHHA